MWGLSLTKLTEVEDCVKRRAANACTSQRQTEDDARTILHLANQPFQDENVLKHFAPKGAPESAQNAIKVWNLVSSWFTPQYELIQVDQDARFPTAFGSV
jgi:hypothetical protein